MSAPGLIRNWLETSVISRGLLAFFLTGVTVFLLSWRGIPFRLQEVEGQPAGRDIVATVDFTYPDWGRTEEAAQAAVARQPPVYNLGGFRPEGTRNPWALLVRPLGGPAAAERLLESLLVRPLRSAQSSPEFPPSVLLRELALGLARDIHESGIMAPEVRDTLLNEGRRYVKVATPSDRSLHRRQLAEVFSPSGAAGEFSRRFGEALSLPPAAAAAISSRLEDAFRPNLSSNPVRTRELREAARRGVEPVVISAGRGERLVEQGEVIGFQELVKLRAYQERLFRERPPISIVQQAVGTAIVVGFLYGIAAFFLKIYQPAIFRSNTSLLLLAVIIFLVLGLSWGLMYLSWNLSPRVAEYFRHLSPVAAGAILICLLLGLRPAVFLTPILAFLSAFMLNRDLGFLLVGVVGGMAGIFAIFGARRRIELFRAGTVVAVCSLAVVAGMGLVDGLSGSVVLKQSLGAVAGSAGAVFVALIALSLFESGFRVFSDIGLLELSDLNHPLLQELMLRAPGTYHHSLIVGALAERAAAAVGANPLLARVGAYFHDVGKIVKPDYFSENEGGGVSRHDRLIPSMSALILIAHVKEGVDLARRHRLDRRIVDIIQQHHGTSLIAYFYDRAERSRQMRFEIEENNFRYPGPRPQTREAAIVMLADAAEAASASLERPTTSRLENLVKKLVRERYLDSQLDRSDLTFIDLKKITDTLIRVLSARFHSRVKYPAAGEPEGRSGGEERKG